MKMRSMKTWIIMFAMLIMVFAAASVDAKTTYLYGSTTRTYTGSTYKMYYNGKLVTNSKFPGLMINDNVMFPYRYTMVQNGPKVKATYTASSRKLTLTLGSQTVKLYLNKKYIKVNGVKKTINTAPLVATVNGTSYIMVPGKALCAALNLKYTYVRSKRAVYVTKKKVKTTTTSTTASKAKTTSTSASSYTTTKLTAKQLSTMSTAKFIKYMGPIAQADYKKTGVLASVTLAQAINESGWGRTTLAKTGNNMFGMKISLSGNTWKGSVWDGKSYVKIYTREEVSGRKVTVTAKFRKYASVQKSVADHSAYLKYAMNGSSRRYKGLTATTSYSKQLKILQKGGYCTWSSYVSELKSIIKKYNLTKYDVK